MDFQRDEGLEVDGEYGEKSHAALMDALSDEEAGNEDGSEETDTPAEPEEPKPLGVTVAITGGSVYVRVGNGTNYRIITTVKAVSYTHLDVYKRQTYIPTRETEATA